MTPGHSQQWLGSAKVADKKRGASPPFSSIPADCDRDSPLILNLSVLLMSFFSCDWV
eukprot:COSAG02_NODE_19597_length_874_cov_0.619355_1_plen_56_part_01